jgi:serine/threonine protein kinase/Tol biopolymer transport system component
MPLTNGTRIGAYEIVAPLGAGGMGEVYRARDTNLGRDVAIKVLPDAFAQDPERLARFEREAKTLAALNHVNVAHVYGLERVDGARGSAHVSIRALVMELVDGPTLADRISQGAIPLEEALKIAKQIAEALDAAHEQGIIHRDLKPANVKVRPDGTVKVLDFGLAKALAPPEGEYFGTRASSPAAMTNSPTLTNPVAVTGVGVILGTAAYMAPEQAKGRDVTRATDIWAFGCVLYEMLTGRAVFTGEDVTEVLAAVVRAEPDWSRVPGATPPAIRTLLRYCLQKDQRRRWQDATSLRIVIDDSSAIPIDAPASSAGETPRRWVAVVALAAAVAAALSGIAVWNLKSSSTPPAPIARVLVGVSPADRIARALPFPDARPFRTAIALSPDGRSLAFVGGPLDDQGPGGFGRARQLYLRRLDRLDATLIPGTEAAESPFFSPDGRWVGFWQMLQGYGGLGELKKIPLDGGPVVTLARTSQPAGISWGPHGRIVFATHLDGALWDVSEEGGTPRKLITPRPEKGEARYQLPHVLPGGEHVVFTIQKSRTGLEVDSDVVVRSLTTGEQKRLLEGAADARYVASGHLVYAQMGTLVAAPFDLNTRSVTGESIRVLEDVMQDVNTPYAVGNSGSTQFSVSASGALAYLPGGATRRTSLVPVWVDRNGAEEPIRIPGQHTLGPGPRISPQGNEIAFAADDDRIAIYDITRESILILTTGRAPSSAVTWHPEEQRLAFTAATGRLFWIDARAGGEPKPLTLDARASAPRSFHLARSWSRSGTLAFEERQETSVSGSGDLWMVTASETPGTPRPFKTTEADEDSVEFSPDGRYVAYVSRSSGRADVYVEPYPPTGRIDLVLNGASQPAWAPGGKELFFWQPAPTGPSRRMMVVNVTLGDRFTAGKPQMLFEAMNPRYPSGTGGRAYDVTHDGRRFLMMRQPDQVPQQPITHVVLVQNWLEELKQRVTGK